MSTIARFTVLALLVAAGPALAVTAENNTHEMAAGDFFGDGRNEIAYIQTDGAIYIHDFQNGQSGQINLPNSELAVKLIAADVNGDGVDDLGVVSSNAGGLRTYDFATQTFSAEIGGSIQDLTAGNIDADPRDEIMVTNTGNSIFLFESGGFSAVAGAGSALATGQFNADASEEFLITGGLTPGSGAGLYAFNGETNMFTTLDPGGGGINRIATGDLHPANPLDEVYLTNTSGLPFVNDGSGYTGTGGNGTEIAIGQLDADTGAQELAYIIGAGGTIFQSQLAWGTGNFAAGYLALPIDPTDNTTPVAGNAGFTDFILADIDKDGLDEIVARKGGNILWLFNNGDEEILITDPTFVPEPATASLLTLTALVLLRRRR